MQDSCPRTPAATSGSSRATLRCPPSPVIRAKEGFFQILREKKREFDSRLDYEFLWLRELKEEVDRSISLGKPLQPSLPTTSTATRKRQRIVLEAREAARAPRAPTPSIFPPTFAPTLPPSASSSPSPRVISIASGSSSRLAGAPTMTRGRRGGSIIKSLFTDAAAKAASNKGKEKDVDDADDFASDKEVQLADDTSTTLDDETVPSPLAAKQPGSVAATPSPSGGAAARLGGRASPSLFEPPRNAWLRTPSPMQTMDGKDVIALRVRKKPLPLAQQNLKKRARELGMSPLATSSPSSSASATASSSSPAAANKEAASPCQELLVTEDDEPIVFHMDLSDEVSPGVTAAFDIDDLREELERSRHEETASGDDGGDEEERRTQTSAILAEEQVVMVGERRTQLADEPEQLPMKPKPSPANRALTPSPEALGSFPTRSGSWFTLGSGLSEAETVLPAPGAKLSEVNLGSNHESDVERRSFVRVSMEIVRSALQELNDEKNGKDDDVEVEEEQKVTAPPSPSRGGQEAAAKKSSSGDKANISPTSGRRSRIIEREERLRQIDLEREKIKRRRMERQSRRRESDLGSVARANPDNAADTSPSASTSTTSTTAQLSSELRQSAPVSIGERRRDRVTTPPSSPRREVLADITTASRPSSPPSATSTTASPRRKKGSPIVPRLDIAKTREAAAKAPGPNSPTSPSLLRNSSRVPPAAVGAVATAADIRRQLRERSSRRVVTVPQPSTLSLSIRERLQHDALHRARTTTAASRQPSPSAAPTPTSKPTATATPATPAQDKAQPRRQREPSPVVVRKPATAAKEMEKKQKAKEDEKKKPVPADAGGGGNASAAAAAGCETVLAYSSLKERKIVDAFLEVIAKEKREREEREQAEKKGRGCVLPYPIPAPGSPSSSFIIMHSPPKRKSLSPGDEATPASASTSTPSSSSGSPPKKRKLENGESASSVDESSSKENVASALNSPHGKPTLQRSTSKETWRGEGEGTLRARQHREREDVHRLYGLDAELARKSAEKLKPDTVREAIVWVYKAARGTTKGSVLMPSSSRGVPGLFDCLKSGRLLCEVANKVRPGIIPKIHIRPIPLMEQENIKMYLAACERMGMRKADLFVVSDLYEEKYLPAVLQNVICLSRLASASSSFAGPHLRM